MDDTYMRLDELISLREAHCSFPCRFYFTYANQEVTDFIIHPAAGVEIISGDFIPLTCINDRLLNLQFDQWYIPPNPGTYQHSSGNLTLFD